MTEQVITDYNRYKLCIAMPNKYDLLKNKKGFMISPIKAIDPLNGSKSTMFSRLQPARRGYFYAYYKQKL